MPAGRPTIYKPIMIAWLAKYIEDCPNVVPSQVGFCLASGITQSRIKAWKAIVYKDLEPERKAKYPRLDEFQTMLAELQAFQEQTALDRGADSTWNSTIAKLVLAKHGYHDKVDKHLSGEVALVPSVEINLPDDKTSVDKGLDDD